VKIEKPVVSFLETPWMAIETLDEIAFAPMPSLT